MSPDERRERDRDLVQAQRAGRVGARRREREHRQEDREGPPCHAGHGTSAPRAFGRDYPPGEVGVPEAGVVGEPGVPFPLGLPPGAGAPPVTLTVPVIVAWMSHLK